MAIARNATFGGAALVTGATGTVSSLTSSAFSCSSSAKLVLVAVGLGNTTGTVNQPVTVSWVGGTPANATQFQKVEDGQNSGNNHTGEFWIARVLGALTSVQVTYAAAASSASSASTLLVDVLDGADWAPGGTICRSTNASARVAEATLVGVRAGSWLYSVGAGEGAATWSPNASTTELDDQRDAGTANAAVGINATGTAGNILVGWSSSVDYGGWAGIEIREPETIGATDGFSGGWDSDRLVHLDCCGTPSDALWPDNVAAELLWQAMFPTSSTARSGTATAMAGTGSLATGSGTRDVAAGVASLAGTGALSTADGVAASGESRSGTATALAGTGTLGAPTATREVSGTVSSLTGTGAVSTGTGAKAVSSTAASLTGTAALSTATGAKAASSTAAALAGAGDLSTAAGTKAVSGTVASLTGAATLSTATGTNGVSNDRTGTGTSLTETGALGTLTGAKAVSSTVATLSGAASLSTLQGYSAKAGTAEALAGLAALGQATGISSEPEDPSGPSSLRPYLTHSRLGHQRPQWNRHYQRRMKGHS